MARDRNPRNGVWPVVLTVVTVVALVYGAYATYQRMDRTDATQHVSPNLSVPPGPGH